jgi:hypothetical protein
VFFFFLFVSNPLLTFESTFDLVAQKQNDEQIAMTIGPDVHSQCSTGKRQSLCVFLSRIKPTQRDPLSAEEVSRRNLVTEIWSHPYAASYLCNMLYPYVDGCNCF